jgi:hypothetical protein
VSGKQRISQREALDCKRALQFLKESVENEKRTIPYSLNVRDALAHAERVLENKTR